MKRDFQVFIYSDYPSVSLNIDLVLERINKLGFSIEYRGNLVDYLSLSEQDIYKLARNLSSVQIPDISTPLDNTSTANRNEIDSEVNRILGRESVRGKFY